jgi:hypothetical protein
LTSDCKIKANRANARASTGPRTARGRASAARNALRHGLSQPVCSDPALSEEVEALAREIAGPDANGEVQELARRVAEAQIDLRRVRYARHQWLLDCLRNPRYESRASIRMKWRTLRPLLPYDPQQIAELLWPEAGELDGPCDSQPFCRKRPNNYCGSTAMNGERCRAANLRYAHSIKRESLDDCRQSIQYRVSDAIELSCIY